MPSAARSWRDSRGRIRSIRANIATTHFSGEAIKAYVDGQDYTVNVAVAGRLVVIRDMGKSQFVKILDNAGQIQLTSKRTSWATRPSATFKKLDLGDIVGAQGALSETKTGEVTVKVERFVLVAKALRPLPEKWHGLSDPEQVYRQRYLDVIVNEESRRRLMLRSRIVSHIPPLPGRPSIPRGGNTRPREHRRRRSGTAFCHAPQRAGRRFLPSDCH
jgi:lysyl-tRNA synthetase class 2